METSDEPPNRGGAIPAWAVALLALVAGWSLVGAGVYLLAGLGWALICAGVPFIVLAVILFRGLTHAEPE